MKIILISLVLLVASGCASQHYPTDFLNEEDVSQPDFNAKADWGMAEIRYN